MADSKLRDLSTDISQNIGRQKAPSKTIMLYLALLLFISILY